MSLGLLVYMPASKAPDIEILGIVIPSQESLVEIETTDDVPPGFTK